MFPSLRSAVLPLLLTMGLLVIIVLGAEDLVRDNRAACETRLPAPASATQSQPATETPIGVFHLSRFDRSGLFGCHEMPGAPQAAVRQ